VSDHGSSDGITSVGDRLPPFIFLKDGMKEWGILERECWESRIGAFKYACIFSII